MQSGRYIAVVEIPSQEDGELPGVLARAAYQASRRGPVALLIPNGADRLVDRELDPVVVSDRGVHGVTYRSVSDAAVWGEIDRNTLVVGSSSDTQRLAHEIGARCLDASSGAPALRALASVYR